MSDMIPPSANTTSPQSIAFSTAVTNAGNAAQSSSTVAASSAPVISEQGRLLSELFKAADQFLRDEYMMPFGSAPVNDSAGIPILKNNISSFLNVETYNNYLFDKAAATLVAQAKDKGIELDVKDVLAQLKSNNSEIAAIKYDDQARLKALQPNSAVRYLDYADIQALTDMYITAKENGIDVAQVWKLADIKSTMRNPEFGWILEDRSKIIPPDLIARGQDIYDRLSSDFGLGDRIFEMALKPLGLLDLAGGATFEDHYKNIGINLDFYSKLIDLKEAGLYYSRSNHDNFLSHVVAKNQNFSFAPVTIGKNIPGNPTWGVFILSNGQATTDKAVYDADLAEQLAKQDTRASGNSNGIQDMLDAAVDAKGKMIGALIDSIRLPDREPEPGSLAADKTSGPEQAKPASLADITRQMEALKQARDRSEMRGYMDGSGGRFEK